MMLTSQGAIVSSLRQDSEMKINLDLIFVHSLQFYIVIVEGSYLLNNLISKLLQPQETLSR